MTAVAEQTKERVLTLNDRCDSRDCGAAALVMVKGVTGGLYFCGHHYNKIVDNPIGHQKLLAFAFEIIDDRWTILNENRGKEEN